MIEEKIKKLYKNYTLSELLQAFLLHEAEFRLRDIHELDEKTIKENYEKVAEMMFNDANVFNFDEVDEEIYKYFISKEKSELDNYNNIID